MVVRSASWPRDAAIQLTGFGQLKQQAQCKQVLLVHQRFQLFEALFGQIGRLR